jgi:hypothetical protein
MVIARSVSLTGVSLSVSFSDMAVLLIEGFGILPPVNHGGFRIRYASQLRQVPRVHLTGRTGPN